MAYSYGLYISPITLTDLTVTIEYDNQELPSQTLTLNDFSVDGDELYSGIRVLSDCSMTIESQGYQTQTYNIVIANIESEMHITLTPAIKYFSKISDGTNTYFVKDTEAREKAEIFIASYNTTEFNDIQSAYQNGKNVILVWDEAIFPLSRISDTFAEFSSIYNHGTNAKFLDFVTCDNQNVWTRDLMSVLDRSLSNLDAAGQAVIDGKADTDLSNVPITKAILTESYNNGCSWYRVYSDGWCEQGGKFVIKNSSVAHGSYDTATLTFLKPFTSCITYNVQAKHDRFNAGFVTEITGQALSAVSVYQVNDSSTTSFTNPYVIWQACGYIR